MNQSDNQQWMEDILRDARRLQMTILGNTRIYKHDRERAADAINSAVKYLRAMCQADLGDAPIIQPTKGESRDAIETEAR